MLRSPLLTALSLWFSLGSSACLPARLRWVVSAGPSEPIYPWQKAGWSGMASEKRGSWAADHNEQQRQT
jgi:hypothetical protein